jgi:hypothetical protein
MDVHGVARALLAAWFAVVGAGAAVAGEPSEAASVEAALRVRHDPPSCEALVAGLRDPAAALAAVVETVELPPWVPLRAARCAARLPSAEPAVRRWVVDAARPGLAEVVVDALRQVEPARAVPLARAALAGPHADRIRERLATSDVPALRALAGSP